MFQSSRNTNASTGEDTAPVPTQGQNNMSNNPQTGEPTSTTSEGLDGALRHLRHVQWEQPNSNAPPADLNPLAASAATDAAREALASCGTGSRRKHDSLARDMVRKPRQSQAFNAGPKPLVLVYHHSMLAHRESDATQRRGPGTQLSVNGIPHWHYVDKDLSPHGTQLVRHATTLSIQVGCRRQARRA